MENMPKWLTILMVNVVINVVCRDFIIAIITLIALYSASRHDNERREMELKHELKMRELDQRNSY